MKQHEYKRKCRQFAREFIAEWSPEYDRLNVFSENIHREAAQRGLLNVSFPPELGGHGLSFLEMAKGCHEMAKVCAPSTFSMGCNHGSLRGVLIFGTPEQQQTYIGETIRSRQYASLCFTEEDVSGSNLFAIKTRAEKTSGGWRLTGKKCMVGNGTAASLYTVFADTYEGDKELGPSIFMVPRDETVKVSENTDKLGFRCFPTPDVEFCHTELPENSLIGRPGDGIDIVLDSLNYMRFDGGIVITGLIAGTLEEVVPWLEEREIYGGGKLISSNLIRTKIGQYYARLRSLKHLLFLVATKIDRAEDFGADASVLKLLSSQLALEATEEVLQLWGWRGIDARYGIQKKFRDARQTPIYEGTSTIQQLTLFRTFMQEFYSSKDKLH